MMKKTALICFLSLFFLSLTSNFVHAQETFHVRFSPPLLELNLNPGDIHQSVIKFENLSDQETDFYPLVQDFVPEGETGGKRFLEPGEVPPNYLLSKWIKVSEGKVTLQVSEQTVIPFTIIVPEDAEPGGHYGAVLLSSKPSTNDMETIDGAGASALVASRTGPIILVRVSGEITESAEITEFLADKEFYEYRPVNFTIRVNNTGNVHLKPFGQITIKNQFGKVKANLPVNEKLSNVLPQSIRKFDSVWEKKGFSMGRFTATLSLTYGEAAQQRVFDRVYFWIIPWKVVTANVLGLIILIFLFTIGLKKYNAWIIAKAEKEEEKGETEQSTEQPTSQPNE